MFHYDREYCYYYEYHKLSNGQTACFALPEWKYPRHTDLYVCFGIANKKKQLRKWLIEDGYGDLDLNITGTCGTEGLIWAYKKIEEAIDYFRGNGVRYYNIIVLASDHRRFTVYEHFLKRLGFRKQNIQGCGLGLIRKV